MPGINFSAKFVLEFAIVLLGASVSVTTMATLRPVLVVGIACIVVMVIGVSYLVCRIFGIPQRTAGHVGCGRSLLHREPGQQIAVQRGTDAARAHGQQRQD